MNCKLIFLHSHFLHHFHFGGVNVGHKLLVGRLLAIFYKHLGSGRTFDLDFCPAGYLAPKVVDGAVARALKHVYGLQ